MQDQNSATRDAIFSNVIPFASESNIGTSKELSYPTTSLTHDDTNSRQYYKKYEHEKILVKDVSVATGTRLGEGGAYELYNLNANLQERGDSQQVSPTKQDTEKQVCLTELDIEKIEDNLAKNISNQLLIKEKSLVSLESNIKLLKSTVQDILDNYFTSLEDFESYKQRFNEILLKNRVEPLPEMEGFIHDIIKGMPSDSSCASEKKLIVFDYSKTGSVASDGNVDLETLGTYSTHEGYMTDFTGDAMSCNGNAIQESDKDVLLKCLLLEELAASVPVIDRELLSGHIKEKLVASTDDIKIQAKKREVELYMLHQETGKSERDIPVRTSCAMKDIRLNEKTTIKGFGYRSYLSRLCNFLCRQFHKSV